MKTLSKGIEPNSLEVLIDNVEINSLYTTIRCSTPTQSLLQKWLREKYNLHLHIYWLTETEKWGVDIYSLVDDSLMNMPLEYCKNNSYEDALEQGLQEALNLI